jgi:(2S)-methylsuccinyl-CoA dehydrogenase
MLFEVSSRLLGREEMWGVAANALSSTHEFMATYREPDFVGSLATTPGPRHLEGEFEMVQDTFRSYATKEIAPRAEHVHRHNADVPEEIIAGLAELGAFGLSVPAEYGGFNEGGEGEYMANCIATEELSRASLGIGGSLITRPDPYSCVSQRRHRGTETILVAKIGNGRSDGCSCCYRTRLWKRCRKHQDNRGCRKEC